MSGVVRISVHTAVRNSPCRRLRDAATVQNAHQIVHEESGRWYGSVSLPAPTNRVEADNGFARWLNFGGEGVIDTIDPVEQEKHLKYNHLVANAGAIQTVIDLTRSRSAGRWLLRSP
jgi:hypothetical protein